MSKKNIEAIYPLSPVQQGMLYETISAPESGIHIEQLLCTFQGALDVAIFKRAWQWEIDRHAILRTGFVWEKLTEPLQVVYHEVAVPLEFCDWRHFTPAEQSQRINDSLLEDRQQRFKLAQAPMMRISLFQLEDEKYYFLWTVHHILMDGWCNALVINEVLSCYQAFCQGHDFSLPASRPYKDYIHWLKQQDLARAEQFWRETLRDFKQVTLLGRESDQVEIPLQPERHGVQEIALPTAIGSALRSLLRRHHVTINTLIQGTWAYILSRYSGDDDVVFGISVSGRPPELEGIETMVGICINTLPMRVKIDGEMSLWSWLTKIQVYNSELRQFEYSPAGLVQHCSELPHAQLLFESLLVVENYPVDHLKGKNTGLNIAIKDIKSKGAQTKYALTFLVAFSETLSIKCVYDTRRIPKAAVAQLLEHFSVIISRLAEGVDGSVASLQNFIPTWQIPTLKPLQKEVEGAKKPPYQAPRNSIEEAIAGIWSELLGEGEVSIHDNFFASGGHSLSVTQLVARVRTVLGVEVPLRAFFNAPTVAGLAAYVEQALKEKQGLQVPPLAVVSRSQDLPLSFTQQRLWFLDQLEPESPAYLISGSWRLQGELRRVALERSLERLIKRHESLRTTFRLKGDHPLQVIHPAGTYHLPLVDLSGLREDERLEEAKRLALQEALRPCDLTMGPLFRVWLLRLESADHAFLLTMHHSISDGWSYEICMREMVTLYRAYVAGEPLSLAPLEIQYADFAVWQRAWLQGEVLEAHLSYWVQQLQGLATLTLPTDYPRVPIRAYRGANQSLRLPVELRRQLIALSQEEGVTLFMLLAAAFQVLLMRYTGQTDVSIGTPIANRTQVELEHVVGFFSNTLVLRTDLSGNPPFVELLKRVHDMALEAYVHQDVPFDKLVEVLQPERELGRSPLFQVEFILQNAPGARQEGINELRLSHLGLEQAVAVFDLVLTAIDTGRDLDCNVQYSVDLFAQSTISQLLEHWRTLLEGIVANPHVRLSDLPLLSRQERHFLLEEWNTDHAVPVAEQCLQTLFEAQVQRTPAAVALAGEYSTLSYAFLEQEANQLAHYLRSQGVGPEVPVGVYMLRSEQLLVALLAVMKAGGVYVPLDPAYPSSRLAFMLSDAKVGLLLTTQDQSVESDLWSGPLIVLEQHRAEIAHQLQTPPQSGVLPANLAYIIYTSGSTGMPKGVMVSHRGLSNLVREQVRAFAITPESHVLQFASLSFDASVAEIAVSLCTGASLYLARNDRLLPGSGLLQLLRECAITVLTVPPSVLAVLEPDSSLSLETLVVAGEVCHEEIVERWARGRHFCNAYGPSEATVCASIAQSLQAGEGTPAIGRPMANTQLYVLDASLQPVPRGIIGELYIGGRALARGYVGQGGLTAERFLPDPFSLQGGARLYKTGDRVRLRRDGMLELVGRVDQQVKVRGYRIELGEIEARLLQHPHIRECVIEVREITPQDQRIVAYIVTHESGELTTGEIRAYLQASLPEYMLPSSSVRLEELPHLPNGKVDRRALLPPDAYERVWDQEIVGARTPIEEAIRAIWSDVMGDDEIGIHENFFDLGGHSLLATQVIARVQEQFALNLPVRSLFDAPTIAGLAEVIEQALRGELPAEVPALRSVSRTEKLPLSFAQQRLWFLDQLEPGSVTYLLPGAWHIKGKVQSQALRRSLEMLIERHESLRTTFDVQDGEPMQVIHPARSFHLPVVDLSGLTGEQREAEILRLAKQETRRPCNLTVGPLLRVTLISVGIEEHVLLLTMHHIISDGWSSEVFVRELMMLYRAMVSGQALEWPPLAIQYADFAVWQRNWLQAEVLQEQLNYWKQQLARITALELPLDYPRPRVQTFHGANERMKVPRALYEQLVSLSQRSGVTLFMTLLASFQVLLQRYSGQRDIAVGTPIANRRRKELEGLIGFFVNTLVLRTTFEDTLSFEELLHRVREVALGAYAHQDVPFEQLVDMIQPERDLSRSPLFQVFFGLQTRAKKVAVLEELTLQALDVQNTTTKFELSLEIVETKDGLDTLLRYNTDLFAPATIWDMLQHWQILLEGITARPHDRIVELPLLSEREQRYLLKECNATRGVYPAQHTLQELFAQQAALVPQRVAVVFEEMHLTYAALDQRTNQLAHHLHSLGVKADTLVGLCCERSVEMIIGLLGILKAGGAYVPLDPTYPQERLAFMLEDTQLTLLLTQRACIQRLPEYRAQMLCLDQAETWWDEERPIKSVERPDLAYVTYTSGSTGRPKGVQIRQQSVVNYVHALQMILAYEPGLCFALVSTLAADLGNTAIFGAMASGGCLHVLPYETVTSQEAFARVMRQRPADVLKIVPSHLSALLGKEPNGEILPRRYLILGGEALPQSLVHHLGALRGTCQIINHYGPTETTIGVLVNVLGEASAIKQEVIPLGKPIANTEAYILDRGQQLVPLGVSGELYLGGAGLAQGYLQRPEQTAERFVPHPFSEEPGARLYRTGDLTRYNRQGQIEFLGRIDDQVKIRGFRIELGEVEATLVRHPDVHEARVIVHTDSSGERRLAGYIVPEPRVHLSKVALRQYLQNKLPDYMIPSFFLELEALPLTANGKVDRRALVKPDRQEERADSMVAQTPLQELLMGIWGEVLGLAKIGVNDNFFMIGGHSLLATRLIAHIRAVLNTELPLRSVFEMPTIARLAHHLEQQLRGGQRQERPPLLPVPRVGDLPLSFAQQRLWFLDQLEPESTAYLMPHGWIFRGFLHVGVLERSLEAMVLRHESLRTTFQEKEGQPVQVVHPAGTFCVPLIDLGALEPEVRQSEARRLATQESHYSCNLTLGPLLRVYLLRLGTDEHLLLSTMHHIISDGWSNRVFANELVRLYQAFRDGRPSPLLPLPIQYADFALWQRSWLQGKVLDELLGYWMRQLGGVPPLELPIDYPRTPRTAGQPSIGAEYKFTLPAMLIEQITALCHGEKVTSFMVLLAAFQALLYRSTGQTDIVVGTDIANRTYMETENLIGFFINLLALRSDLSGAPTFRHLLHRVRETVLGAYSHADIPFEMLVEKLQDKRTLDRAPLVQVLFVLQNLPDFDAELPDVRVSSFNSDVTVTKVELALFLFERPSGLDGLVNYRADLFEAHTIATLMKRFVALLQSIVAAPDVPINVLEMTIDDDKQKEEKRASSSYQKLMTIKKQRMIEHNDQ